MVLLVRFSVIFVPKAELPDVVPAYFVIYIGKPSDTMRSLARMTEGKDRFVVTTNSEGHFHLALRRDVWGSRNPEKAGQVVSDIVSVTENQNVASITLDTASLAPVRRAAAAHISGSSVPNRTMTKKTSPWMAVRAEPHALRERPHYHVRPPFAALNRTRFAALGNVNET